MEVAANGSTGADTRRPPPVPELVLNRLLSGCPLCKLPALAPGWPMACQVIPSACLGRVPRLGAVLPASVSPSPLFSWAAPRASFSAESSPCPALAEASGRLPAAWGSRWNESQEGRWMASAPGLLLISVLSWMLLCLTPGLE